MSQKEVPSRVVLLGSITEDIITQPGGKIFRSLGGVLYQASVFCALGRRIELWAHLGENLAEEFQKLTKNWFSLDITGVKVVPQPGNRVHLRYPLEGEREEILENIVPPLELKSLIKRLSSRDFLMAVINSGFDFRREDWRRLVERVNCSIWLDIHSLALEPVLGEPRSYRSLPDWSDWAKGVTWLQANRQELACLLGHPTKQPAFNEMLFFSQKAASLGVKAVVITLGRAGVFLGEGEKGEIFLPPTIVEAVDTTGCGDVLAAATVIALREGRPIREALRWGMELAAVAAQVKGVAATFRSLKASDID